MAKTNKKQEVVFDEFLASQMTCNCKQRIDVKTYKMWLAEGMVVQKGQKALKTKSGASVFCRCQVAPIKPKEETPAKTEKAPAKPQQKEVSPKSTSKKEKEVVQVQVLEDEYAIKVKKHADVVKVANMVAKKYWNMELDVPVVLNGRMKRSLGYCRYRGNHLFGFKAYQLDFAAILFSQKRFSNELIVKVIKHEVCHWACNRMGKPCSDGDKFFESELVRVGSVSNKTKEIDIKHYL